MCETFADRKPRSTRRRRRHRFSLVNFLVEANSTNILPKVKVPSVGRSVGRSDSPPKDSSRICAFSRGLISLSISGLSRHVDLKCIISSGLKKIGRIGKREDVTSKLQKSLNASMLQPVRFLSTQDAVFQHRLLKLKVFREIEATHPTTFTGRMADDFSKVRLSLLGSALNCFALQKSSNLLHTQTAPMVRMILRSLHEFGTWEELLCLLINC